MGGCGKEGKYHIAKTNVTKYAEKLNWPVDPKLKARRIALCKAHYRDYKKLNKEDTKYEKLRDYDKTPVSKQVNRPRNKYE